MGADHKQLGVLRCVDKRPDGPVAGDNHVHVNVGILFQEGCEAFLQQLGLFLFHHFPFLLRGSQAGQGGLDLHVYPRVDGLNLGAPGVGLGEGEFGGLLGHV